MSKIWLFALILSCAATVALAKDKDKGSGGSGSSNRDTSKRAPAASAPRSTPAPAPRQSPALGPAQRPSEAPPATQRPTPAPKSNPAPAPVPKAAPAPEPSAGKSATPKSDPPTRQTEPQPRSSVRPASPPAASQPATPTAPNTNSSGAALPAAPSGKTGTAFGPQPAPKSAEKVESGRPLRPSAESSHEHKHSTNSPPPTTTPSKPLPTPPKLETSRKIPAFGSPLTGTSKEHQPGHDHSHSVPQKSASQPIVRDHDHDHDHNDDHHDGHPGSGHSHRHGSRSSNRLSWLIIGGSLFGPTSYGYGFGYGPGYGVPYAPRRVYVPVQPYDATVNMKPAPISGPPAQTQLTLDEFAALPLERQRELLLQALNALEDDLARSPNGDVWSRHLQLATIAKLVTEGNEPPNATTRARLRSIVVLFEEVAANIEYRQVSDLLSFRTLHLGLLEFSAEPIDRARRQLSQAAFGLSKTLEAWSSGPSWRDYLQVPWLIGTEEELKLDLDARQARFEKLLEKFDRVQADEQFRAVNQTQEFRRTHESLRRFVRDLQVFVEQIRREESANTESANPSDP